MASLKAKLFSGLGVALLLFLAWLYVSGLKAERDEAREQVGRLSVVVEAQDKTIKYLREDRGDINELLKEWRLTRESIATERAEKREATKEAHRTDTAFTPWAAGDLPMSVQSGGLLGKKRSADGAGSGGSVAPGRVDGAHAGSGVARQDER